MGPSSLTPPSLLPIALFLPFALCKALTTSTTTLLRSLAGPGGAFDAPTQKCPPDRKSGGSSGCVTGSLASGLPSPLASFPFNFTASSPASSTTSSPSASPSLEHRLVYPFTPPRSSASLGSFDDGGAFATEISAKAVGAPAPILLSAPRNIPSSNNGFSSKNFSTSHGLNTPPLTPDSGLSSSSGSSDGNGLGGSVARISARQRQAALDFLTSLFPRSGLSALPYARSVRIASTDSDGGSGLGLTDVDAKGGFVFEGVVLELPGTPKTLYVDGKGAEHIKLRESIVALLDLADEHLECGALVIALDRTSPALGDLLHHLLYVGAAVVSKPPFHVDEAYVLVGMEI